MSSSGTMAEWWHDGLFIGRKAADTAQTVIVVNAL
jgi:hypothetical protein